MESQLACNWGNNDEVNANNLSDMHWQVNGNGTLPENIADNGGLHASFQVSLQDTTKIQTGRGRGLYYSCVVIYLSIIEIFLGIHSYIRTILTTFYHIHHYHYAATGDVIKSFIILLLCVIMIIIIAKLGLSYEGGHKSSTNAPFSPVHSWSVVLHHIRSGNPANEIL
jgi:hypothetical protein